MYLITYVLTYVLTCRDSLHLSLDVSDCLVVAQQHAHEEAAGGEARRESSELKASDVLAPDPQLSTVSPIRKGS